MTPFNICNYESMGEIIETLRLIRNEINQISNPYEDYNPDEMLQNESLAELMFDTDIPYDERFALFEQSVEQQFNADEGKLVWQFFENFWDLYTIIAEPEFYYLDFEKDKLMRILEAYRSKIAIAREIVCAMKRFEGILGSVLLHDVED